jgi:hypothetical protein
MKVLRLLFVPRAGSINFNVKIIVRAGKAFFRRISGIDFNILTITFNVPTGIFLYQ